MKKYTTPDEERALHDESSDAEQIITSLGHVAIDGLTQHEMRVAELLLHPSLVVREEALETLVAAWALPKYVGTALNLLEKDPSLRMRRCAATCLGLYLKFTQDRELAPQIMLALARTARAQEPGLAEFAYKALAEVDMVLQGTPFLRAHVEVSSPEQFDRSLIARYLAEG